MVINATHEVILKIAFLSSIKIYNLKIINVYQLDI